MPMDVQISFLHMDTSEPLEELVRSRAAELEQLSDRITLCRVVVEAASKSQRNGRPYHVRVELSVPGSTIMVDRDPGNEHAHQDAYAAVRHSFEAARRRLQDYSRKMDDRGKVPPPMPPTLTE